MSYRNCSKCQHVCIGTTSWDTWNTPFVNKLNKCLTIIVNKHLRNISRKVCQMFVYIQSLPNIYLSQRFARENRKGALFLCRRVIIAKCLSQIFYNYFTNKINNFEQNCNILSQMFANYFHKWTNIIKRLWQPIEQLPVYNIIFMIYSRTSRARN